MSNVCVTSRELRPIAPQIERSYQARFVGEVTEVEERFYVISPERKLKHPAVVRITETARERLFE